MSNQSFLYISYQGIEQRERAEAIAHALGIPLNPAADRCLLVGEDKLALKIPGFSLLYPDFSSQTWKRRRGEGGSQGLIRACKPKSGMNIIDATAGWGRDAAILASFGAQVLLLERNPIMALLLEDALNRRTDEDKDRMQLSLIHTDTILYLADLQPHQFPDLIYIDPMHPERSKSALVKKEMQALQHMIGPDEDARTLIHIAVTKVKHKVVVKWPQKRPALVVPNASIEGKTIRFDFYIP